MTVRLGDVARLNYGKPMRERDRQPGKVPVVGSAGSFGTHAESNVLTSYSLIIGRKGTAGSVTWFDAPVWATDTCFWVEPNEEAISPRFLRLALEHADLAKLSAQTGVPGLNRDRAYETAIGLPHLEEQRRIVDLVDSLDETIDAAEEQASTLVTTHFRLVASLTQAAHPASRRVKLQDVMSLDLNKVNVVEGKRYPLAGILNRGRGLLLKEAVTSEGTKYSQLTKILPRQVVYSKLKAFEGSITVAPAELDERYASSEFPTFTCSDNLLPGYFRLHSMQPSLWEQLALFSKGMGGRRERLSPNDFLALEIDVPPLHVQKEAVEATSTVETARHEAAECTLALRSLRSEMLTTLLSGSHTIPKSYVEVMEQVGDLFV